MRLTRCAPWAAAAGGAAVVLAPLGYRLGAPLGLAFLLLAGGFLAAAVGGLLFALRMVRGAGLRDRGAAAALAAVAAVGVFPLAALVSGRGAPPIHDVTTDPDDPPAFVAAVALNAPGRTDWAGPALAEQQRAAYPDLAPALLPAPPAAAFDRALAAVREMGWEVLDADAGALRIEATDRTFWFGFADDVVIRIAADGAGSRVDVRSLSRVGVGDLGVNARRVRAFMAALHAPQ